MTSTPLTRRSRKLIQPGLQLRLIASFVGLAAFALCGQFLLLGYRLTDATASMDGAGGQLAAEIPRVMLEVLTFSLLILLPVIFAFGVLLTFRIAGPVYRFEQYLQGLAAGEELGPCRIREGDELQNLCEAINAATAPLQRTGDAPADAAPAPLRKVG